MFALIAIAACAPLRRMPANDRVTVTFVNESPYQLDMFAVTPSGSYRLTTLSPGRTEQVNLSEMVISAADGGVNFVGRVFPGRGAIDSGPVTLMRGDHIQIRVPTTLNSLIVTPG